GDFGESNRSGRPVIDLFASRLPATLQLVIGATIIALLVSLPVGILSALRRGSKLDRLSMGLVSAGLAVPSFWLGLILLLVFSVRLGWVAPSGHVSFGDEPVESLRRMLLPAITLGVYLAATLTRFLRADMIEVMATDYIRTARAKGL